MDSQIRLTLSTYHDYRMLLTKEMEDEELNDCFYIRLLCES